MRTILKLIGMRTSFLALALATSLSHVEIAIAELRVPGDCPTIQECIAKAQPKDIINISGGPYNENLTISTCLTLSAQGPSEIVIQSAVAVQSTISIINTPPIMNEECVIIKGFKVTGSSRAGIEVENSKQILLTHNTITENEYGISISSSTDVVVDTSVITNNVGINNFGIGISINRGSVATVHGLLISNNGGADGSGIEVLASNAVISGNEVAANRGYGVIVRDHAFAKVHSNEIADNGNHGIEVSNSRAEIEGNTIRDNGANGITARDSDLVNPTIVRRNVIRNNRNHGIEILRSPATIDGNLIERNRGCGLRHDTESQITESGNTIVSNGLGIICLIGEDTVPGFERPAKNLSGSSSLNPRTPDIAAVGSSVYVVWESSGDVLFTRSTDEGAHFSSPISLSSDMRESRRPRVTAAGPDVYVVWEGQTTTNSHFEIFFVHSSDGGRSWNPVKSISDNGTEDSRSPAIAVDGPDIYVVWEEGTEPHRNVIFRRSTDTGENFDEIRLLGLHEEMTGTLVTRIEHFSPAVAAAGSNVYIVWVRKKVLNYSAETEILYTRSIDQGEDFVGDASEEPFFQLSRDYSSHALNPAVAAVGAAVYVAYEDHGSRGAPRSPEILFSLSTDGGISFGGELVDAMNTSISPTSDSVSPKIAAAGSGFSIVWQEKILDDFDISLHFASLLGLGALDWNNGEIANLTETDGITEESPSIAMAGSKIYVVWQAGPFEEAIMFRGTIPLLSDGPEKLSLKWFPGPSINPNIAVEGTDVYAVWAENTITGLDIFFRSSHDGGANFGGNNLFPYLNLSDPLEPSNGITRGNASAPQVAVAGQAVYVVWQDETDSPGNHDIFFRRSLDRGKTWYPPMDMPPLNLSEFPDPITGKKRSPTDSRSPTLAATGSEVYVAWEDDDNHSHRQIFFRRSLDQGVLWEPSVKGGGTDRSYSPTQLTTDCIIDTESGMQSYECATGVAPASIQLSAFTPSLAAAGSNVYVAALIKSDGVPSIAFFMSTVQTGPIYSDATVSTICGGQKLTSYRLGLEFRNPKVVAAGSFVYVVWEEQNKLSEEGTKIYFRRAKIVGGQCKWTPDLSQLPFEISSGVRDSRAPTLAAAGSEVYIAWHVPQNVGAAEEIFFTHSKDNGQTFTAPTNLSHDEVESHNPSLAASGPELYLGWDDGYDAGYREISFRTSRDEGTSFESREICFHLSDPNQKAECKEDTPVGIPITIDLLPVTITFDHVRIAGTTRLTVTDNGPSPPPNVFFGTSAKYYDLSTTAQYIGKLFIAIRYDDTRFPRGARLRLFHQNGGVWEDVTRSFDPASKVVSGVVRSLSTFAIGFSLNRCYLGDHPLHGNVNTVKLIMANGGVFELALSGFMDIAFNNHQTTLSTASIEGDPSDNSDSSGKSIFFFNTNGPANGEFEPTTGTFKVPFNLGIRTLSMPAPITVAMNLTGRYDARTKIAWAIVSGSVPKDVKGFGGALLLIFLPVLLC